MNNIGRLNSKIGTDRVGSNQFIGVIIKPKSFDIKKNMIIIKDNNHLIKYDINKKKLIYKIKNGKVYTNVILAIKERKILIYEILLFANHKLNQSTELVQDWNNLDCYSATFSNEQFDIKEEMRKQNEI